jgi:hypothetical protein
MSKGVIETTFGLRRQEKADDVRGDSYIDIIVEAKCEKPARSSIPLSLSPRSLPPSALSPPPQVGFPPGTSFQLSSKITQGLPSALPCLFALLFSSYSIWTFFTPNGFHFSLNSETSPTTGLVDWEMSIRKSRRWVVGKGFLGAALSVLELVMEGEEALCWVEEVEVVAMGDELGCDDEEASIR